MVKIRFNRTTDTKGWGFKLSWEHHIVVNWTILKKSILLLILAAFMSLFWISWDIFVLTHPQYAEWVNLGIVRSHLITSLITLTVMLLLIIPCAIFKDRTWAQNVLPILSVQIFTAMLCHKGYLAGSFSGFGSI